jgi:hypothetical protein
MNYVNYIKVGISLIAVCSIFFAGWHIRDRDFTAYKVEQQNIAKAQEAHVESIKKQQELVTKGVADEYEAKLAAVRNYYKSTSVWNNASASKVPGISAAPSTADVVAAYNVLAGQCAATTAQLTSLQDWINQQIGIK